MLYKKKNTPRLDHELFKNPTAEYRSAAFWSWNCKLDQKELEWQLEVLKEMGMGGAYFHVRSGMATPYLSEEYMDIVKACIEKCKKEHMLAWMYDEDRWPSGAAGGLVTKDKKYRGRYLLFTPIPYSGIMGADDLGDGSTAKATRAENGRLLACYDVELDEEGYLLDYHVIPETEPAQHEKWYAYLELQQESPWYNNQTYVNTLDKVAMDRFIEITYETYYRAIGNEFGESVPAIFTDEPQFTHKSTLRYATEKGDVTLPWTDDLPVTYAEAYNGEDLLSGVPELIWNLPDGKISVLRYHYHDHVAGRFTQAFTDNLGNWCKEHGLALTGHMMAEPTLYSQTLTLGEVMRNYRSFELPGFDMLCAFFEYTTAKQAQSVAHQYGREGVLSELYGVTGWDFDFRGHKLHGDWQAALGATVHAPHLSLVTLAGEGKRDFPASINYQTPWWKRYSLIEDYFARVNTALTRGKPLIRVGVIHPIESYWLHWGPPEQTALVRAHKDRYFQSMTEWLLFGGIDFDFISESLLPDLCKEKGAPLKVGEMNYDVILVPECETLRSTTLDCLERFAAAGGKLVFAGELPTLENAVPSERGAALARSAKCIPFSRLAILKEMEQVRLVDIRDRSGAYTENLLHQIRQDGEGRWLFVAHGKEPYNKDISTFQDIKITLDGCWRVKVYNAMNGAIEDIEQQIRKNKTEVFCRMYDYDSLLLWTEPAVGAETSNVEKTVAQETLTSEKRATGEGRRNIPLPETVSYTLSEPNALLLDQAEYALDEGEWQPKEEILRLDDACRLKLGWSSRKLNFAQPWVVPEEPVTHTVRLRWRVMSDISCDGLQLAVEDAEKVQIKWNGQDVDNTVIGWYVDKSIKTVELPPLLLGENILEATIPFGKTTNIEWVYLLGEFGVEVRGRTARIIPARKELAFGDFTRQGLPFYGGNITYHVPIDATGGSLKIRSGRYRGAMQAVCIDDGNEIPIIYPPYTAELGVVRAGKHMVNITLYGHRNNGFGPVHFSDSEEVWVAPTSWRSDGERWSYEYMIKEEGILSTPEITETL